MENDYSRTACADLEIGLRRGDAESYNIEIRYSEPGSDVDNRTPSRKPVLRVDMAALLESSFNAESYGKKLSEFLFADSDVESIFAQACSTDAPLRLRLFVGADASELHNLRWETLRHPQDGRPLLTGERVFFSRYLSSYDWRPVRQRSLNELRALVVIANPVDLADYSLAPVDVEGELDRVKTALDTIPVTAQTAGEKASLETLSAKLVEGYDILYVVCHGALIKGEPRLYLEDEAGHVARVPGLKLVNRLQELQRPPQLVILASCQSAGTGDANVGKEEGGLAALGPQLAEAGIPAVLAMQGNVTMETVKAFMPTFFAELRRHGYIDRAVAVARGTVRERPDSWMPVLFMRLKSGRLWYTPGFTNDHGMEKWDALIENVRTDCCIPILGPGLNESLFGSYREIARNWAKSYRFPMAPQDQEDLPRVAQYLAAKQQKKFPRARLQEYLCNELRKRYPSLQTSVNASLADLIRVAGISWRKEWGSSEPNTVLASLNASIYITTNWDDLLEEALRERKKEPQSALCPWWIHDEDKNRSSIFLPPSDYCPDRDKPLVYHLFGRHNEPRSLVLTEDDYFDFLIGATRNRDLIPPVVRAALADRGLLFLGFEMEDWNFRVVYRSIISQEGSRLNEDYAHIAAQINPEEGRILEPERARRYLEEYFKNQKIDIYWGSVEEFIQELQRQLER